MSSLQLTNRNNHQLNRYAYGHFALCECYARVYLRKQRGHAPNGEMATHFLLCYTDDLQRVLLSLNV